MKRFFTILFIVGYSVLAYAEGISSLLQKFDNISELYHKTKVESAGLLTLYSRYDLDRMQAYKLKDILKSLRFFTYKEGYVGEAALSPSGSSSVLSSTFRLYIDDHEVSSPIYGSAMLQFAEMDLGFVDHIEIYEGGNAISFGNEPGLVTIKIYSKRADRENGTTIGILGDNLGTKEAKVCFAKKFKDSENSILVYVAGGDISREHLYGNSSDYSKDSKQNTLYVKYDFGDKGDIVLGNFQQNKDAFVGVGMRHTPMDPNEIDRRSSFVNLKLLLPKSFSLTLSMDRMYHKMLFSDRNKIYIIQNPLPFTYFRARFSEEVYKINLKQKIEHNQGLFSWGVQDIYKDYNIDYMLMDSTLFTNPTGPTRLNILSAYAEESYNIDENNLLIATLKVDRYSNNYSSNNSSEYIARLGYIHLFSKDFTFKTFLTKTYIYPGFAYTSSFPNLYLNNPNLKPEHYNFLIAEFKYNMPKDSFKIGSLYIKATDGIVYNAAKRTFINSSDSVESARFFIDYTHNFNLENKITAEIYTTYYMEDIVEKSPIRGALLRSLNTIGKFDIFNELIYRSSYTYPLPAVLGGPIKIKSGFDYNVGVKWHVNHAFTLSIKGENILNKASKTPIFGLGGATVSDRRVMAQVEYFF